MSEVKVALRPGDRLIVEYVTEPARSAPTDDLIPLDRLPVSVRSARALIARGKLPATKQGRAYLVRRADVERLFAPTKRAPATATDSEADIDARFLDQLRAKGAVKGESP